MSKRKNRNQQDNGTVPPKNETVAGSNLFAVDKPKARVTSFVPRACSACDAFRKADAEIDGKSCSRVYSTQGRTRYCKCGYCGITWKEIADI